MSEPKKQKASNTTSMSRHVKSRSGCRVCKAKRLKCDETVPACRNCVNRGIQCPGYRQVLRWSTKYEHPVPSPSSRGGGSSGKGKKAAPTTIPEFSELATAASESIKPSSPPRQTTMTTDQAPPLSFDSYDFDPVVKTEAGPSSRQPLSQVPAAPSSSVSMTGSGSASVPISSLSPTPSSTSSSSISSGSSYGQHVPPVVPVLANKAPTSAPDLYSFEPSSSFPYSTIPTSTVAAVASPLSQTSLIPTASNTNWQLSSLDSFNDPIELLDQHDESTKDKDASFTLELWQPDRFRRQRQQHQNQLLLQHPTRGLALPGTSLVELWFSSVCGMWAAYDSPANPFRRLCSKLWSSNEAVFFSLQTMAAASLPKRPPSVSEIVMLAPQMSTQALIQELQELFGPDGPQSDKVHSASHAGGGGKFPAGLLTSLFCMSSSLSWIDARQLGIQYLRNARSVIELLDLRASQLSADDRELLEFFRGCLLYEEMLRSIVTDDQEDIQALLEWSPAEADKKDLHLHAWAGVPIVLIGLFGKVMALCRRSRKVWRKTARATYQLLYQAMQDIQEGQALEAMLLSIEIPLASDGDELKTHIYKAAEAFRLSSLLQLYQTFPDLVTQHQQTTQAPAMPGMPGMPSESTPGWLLPLVLHIVDLLGGIPADSPMRCLQPLLCLCAGSALRVETGSDAVGATSSVVDLVRPAVTSSSMTTQSSMATTDFSSPVVDLSLAGASSSSNSNSSAVNAARNALRNRLAKLEQNLPPRPITVARQLLETVWLTYDMEKPPSRSHWLDIMAETNFESVFG